MLKTESNLEDMSRCIRKAGFDKYKVDFESLDLHSSINILFKHIR